MTRIASLPMAQLRYDLGWISSCGLDGEICWIFAAAKMAHLSDDTAVAKMGHPVLGNSFFASGAGMA